MFKRTKEKFQASTQDSVENIGQLKSIVKYRLNYFLNGRSADQSMYVDNFELVLEKWGISEEEIAQVCHALKVRCFALLLPLLIAFVLFLQGKLALAILISSVTLFYISSSLWRLKVLKKRQFLPYLTYLFGFKKANEG